MGYHLTLHGDFVGVPVVTWLRINPRTGATTTIGTHTDPDTPRRLTLTADDVGCAMRATCVGPFGGPAVSHDSPVVNVDAGTAAELTKLQARKDGASFSVRVVPGNEPRLLVLNHQKLKLRVVSGMKRRTAIKHDFAKGAGVALSDADDRLFTLELRDAPHASLDFLAGAPPRCARQMRLPPRGGLPPEDSPLRPRTPHQNRRLRATTSRFLSGRSRRRSAPRRPPRRPPPLTTATIRTTTATTPRSASLRTRSATMARARARARRTNFGRRWR